MTVVGRPGGYGHNDEDTNARRAWRSSELEETFTPPPGAMVCPLHGGGYLDHRRAPPPPPPQLAAVASRRCRSRNAAVSQSHGRHQATRDEPPDVYCSASQTCTNDGYYFTDERPFPLGYGWVEPGRGWTRSHRPTSCRVPPSDAPKDVKKSPTLGNDASRDWFNTPSVRDTVWAMSYLSRESDLPRQQKVRRKLAKEQAGRHGYHHRPKMVPLREKGYHGSTASRRPNAACLAETHIMQHVSCCWLWRLKYERNNAGRRCECS